MKREAVLGTPGDEEQISLFHRELTGFDQSHDDVLGAPHRDAGFLRGGHSVGFANSEPVIHCERISTPQGNRNRRAFPRPQAAGFHQAGKELDFGIVINCCDI